MEIVASRIAAVPTATQRQDMLRFGCGLRRKVETSWIRGALSRSDHSRITDRNAETGASNRASSARH
jgi:hypothetical protein